MKNISFCFIILTFVSFSFVHAEDIPPADGTGALPPADGGAGMPPADPVITDQAPTVGEAPVDTGVVVPPPVIVPAATTETEPIEEPSVLYENDASAPSSSGTNSALPIAFGGIGAGSALGAFVLKLKNKKRGKDDACAHIKKELDEKNAMLGATQKKISLQEILVAEAKEKLDSEKDALKKKVIDAAGEKILGVLGSKTLKKAVHHGKRGQALYEKVSKRYEQGQKALLLLRAKREQQSGEIRALETSYKTCILAQEAEQENNENGVPIIPFLAQGKKVLTFGTFDALHDGHRFFLDFAKKQGETLVVSVAHDAVVAALKHKTPRHTQKERAEQLLHEGLADSVVFGDEELGNWSAIRNEKPDIIVVGYDQIHLLKALEAWKDAQKLSFAIVVAPDFKGDALHSSLLSKEA